MMDDVFSISNDHKPRAGLTISTSLLNSENVSVNVFSLGADTDIASETYDRSIVYIGIFGNGDFMLGQDRSEIKLCADELLLIKSGDLCGIKTKNGVIYTEIISRKELNMNKAIKAGTVIKLVDLLPYENGSIINMDIVSNETMKLALMAFDAGTGLSEHRAPGDALVFALEGKAIIGYEGHEYEINAGENFHFEKNGLHNIKAIDKFKMALLLVMK